MEISSGKTHLRLSQLTATVSAAVNKAFAQQRFWVVADVTSHTFKADSDYHYFDLVEKDPNSNRLIAKISAKAWGSGSDSIANFQLITGQRFTNNIQVLVHVSVQYHAVYGLQLNLIDIDVHFTLGVLEQQRLATLEKLLLENPDFIEKAGEGYITHNKRLPLPRVIQHIAVVSSKTSAGWQDFRHTLENNPNRYNFFIDDYFTVVQGEANVQQLVDRLVDVFRSGKSYDAVVLIRGGGSQTDFLIFDHYLVGKAIAKFPIPVITGIGHQKNETIADLMAHLATKTPTKAAEFIINHNRTFEEALTTFQKNIIIRSQQQFSGGFQLLGQLRSVIVNQSKSILYGRTIELMTASAALSTKPQRIVYNKTNDLGQIAANIRTFKGIYLKNQQGYLAHLTTMIRVLSPESALNRGFAIIKVGRRITGDPEQLVIGQDVEILMRQKVITATVKSNKHYHGKDVDL
jgi:exodeoxyribonuclease VII large subunit